MTIPQLLGRSKKRKKKIGKSTKDKKTKKIKDGRNREVGVGGVRGTLTNSKH